MRRRENLWALHSVASAYGCRPSEVLGVEDGWAAYQLDLACLMVAREVERLTLPGEDGTPGLDVGEVVGAASGEELETRRLARKFADPRGRPMGRMVIPDSGVW